MSTQDNLRLLTALTDIYELTKDKEYGISVINVLEENNVKYRSRVSQVLKRENIITVSRNKNKIGSVKWNSIKPNIKMVERINQECIQLNRLGNEKTIKPKNRVNEVQEELIKFKGSCLGRNLDQLFTLDEIYQMLYYNVIKRDNYYSLGGFDFSFNKDNFVNNYNYAKKVLSTDFPVEFMIQDGQRMSEAKKSLTKTKRKYTKKPKVQPTTFNVEKCKAEPKQYKKEFKIFGLTIYSTITTQL